MVRVYQRGPSTGSGTGGGGGGGGSSGGGYDRYIGTLGTVANKPTSSKFPHYETFPAAEKYDWVRVVTESKINGVDVLEGQEWICNTKTEKDLSANWEVRSNSMPFSKFGALDSERYVGTLGEANDAPQGAKKPHYTEFPAANKGDWVQVVSTYKVADLEYYEIFLVSKGEAYLCLTDNTAAEDPSQWELIKRKSEDGIYSLVARIFAGRYDYFSVNEFLYFVDFSKGKNKLVSYAFAGNASLMYITADGELVNITKAKNYAALANASSIFDIEADVVFESDTSGDRVLYLEYSVYAKNNDGSFEKVNGAGRSIMEKVVQTATHSDESVLNLSVKKFSLQWFSLPETDNRITSHYLSIGLSQTSGISLKIHKVTLDISFFLGPI